MAKYETIPAQAEAIRFTSEKDVAALTELLGGARVSWNGVELKVWSMSDYTMSNVWHKLEVGEWVVLDATFPDPFIMQDEEFVKLYRPVK